ncbi:Pyridine nucleotide-disulphide oxidoreductase [Halomicrobium zhouii]|uniref:Pyridine nucleotide-disulphide oxidoreductase n=1 Tax=Halomicrobium zhouii TaxID=767519 RepID=A0A1I6MAF8_9EURY|nr:FAD-dependent oxidoreductase [Halomicrobium zhouii]SFS12706.1 Pyridine nucleotide-disulphide oxidoreductase [Halomicrobium zhouii]
MTSDTDVVVVGGGPAGCSAGIFTARYGLDTVVFDCGRSSLKQCAYLENYLGFPAGVDIETLYRLMHDHAEEAGCEFVTDLVESVERADDGDGFVVTAQEGRERTADYVVAATRYDGEYLRPLDGDAMFDVHDHGGEEHEHFDRDYADHDGTTPIDGLYVASPSAETDRQAIIAAGRGARVGLAVVGAGRREQRYPEAFVDHYDWVRREAQRDNEWADRDRWREWFAERLPSDHDLDEDRLVELREREIDRRLDTYVTESEVSARAERGQRRLLAHLDDDLVLERAREIREEVDAAE